VRASWRPIWTFRRVQVYSVAPKPLVSAPVPDVVGTGISDSPSAAAHSGSASVAGAPAFPASSEMPFIASSAETALSGITAASPH
jgi:hypothetical protein